MTCIVGIADKGSVMIGADSAGVAGMGLTIRADRKAFANRPFVMGFTSSFRMGQLLQYSLVAPAHHPDISPHRFMVTSFVDAVRGCLKDGGFAEKDKEVERGGTFLVGYRGRLFTVQGDYQVAESVDGFAAIGCGQDLALGSLCSTTKLRPRERILRALAAAERYSAGVRGPFHIVVGGKI